VHDLYAFGVQTLVVGEPFRQDQRLRQSVTPRRSLGTSKPFRALLDGDTKLPATSPAPVARHFPKRGSLLRSGTERKFSGMVDAQGIEPWTSPV